MTQDNKKATTYLASDAPLEDIQADRFSRSKFSRRVAEVIAQRNDSSSIVVGIYGQWGDGKTTVLNFIANSLKDNNNVICTHFNPWRFGNEDELLMGFFARLSEAMQVKLITSVDELKKVANKIKGTVSKFLTNSEILEDLVGLLLSEKKIEDFKKRVEKNLESSGKRVVVFIDDIDRLDKDEIFSLFRLVKLTANFKNITYILAFDKDIVASSLQSRYGGSTASGEEFLEKIIQVPLHLPHIQKEVLVDYCLEDIDRVLDNFDFSLDKRQKYNLTHYFKNTFDSYITTPRKAKQYTNAITFALPLLKDEVDTIDLMLLEALRVFCPDVYDFIKSNKYKLLQGVSVKNNDTYNEELPNVMNKNKIFSLLEKLFPDNKNNNALSGKKVCVEEYFDRYFLYSTPQGQISDSDYNQLIESVKNWDESDANNPLRNSEYSEDIEKWLDKIIFHLPTEKENIGAKLVKACCQISGLYHLGNLEKKYRLYENISSVVLTYLESYKNHMSSKQDTVKKCLDLASVVLITHIYYSLDKREFDFIKDFSREKIAKFIYENTKENGENIFDKNKYLLRNIQDILTILDNKDTATDYVKCAAQRDGFLIGMFDFLINKDVFVDEDYSKIDKYFDTDKIYKLIHQKHPDIDQSNQQNLKLIKGFCSVHRQK